MWVLSLDTILLTFNLTGGHYSLMFIFGISTKNPIKKPSQFKSCKCLDGNAYLWFSSFVSKHLFDKLFFVVEETVSAITTV